MNEFNKMFKEGPSYLEQYQSPEKSNWELQIHEPFLEAQV